MQKELFPIYLLLIFAAISFPPVIHDSVYFTVFKTLCNQDSHFLCQFCHAKIQWHRENTTGIYMTLKERA